MKFKFLGIYSIISLMFAGDIFAVAESSERDRRMAELGKQTENVNVKNLRDMWEKRSKEAHNDSLNIKYKKGKYSENKADRETVSEEGSLTDSQTTLVAEEIDTKPSVSSDFNKFAENLESKFFELKKILNGLEQKVEDFSGDLEDSESSVERQQKAESLKRDLSDWGNKIVDQIADFEKVQKDFESLEIDKKIKQLSDYRAKIENMSANVSRKISQIQTNRRKEEKAQKKEKKRLTEQAPRPIDWQAIKKYNEEDLSKFVQAIQNYKLRSSVIERYGKKCFDDQDARALFDPNLKMNPSLKGLCKQIYEDRFPEAIKVWSEIKEMKKDDPNYAATVNNLRQKIKALGKNVSSLIKQGSKEPDSSPNHQN